MQQMTFGECVKRTWASAREAATQMPLLMLGAFLVYTVLACVAFAGRPMPGEGEMPSGGLVFAANIASLLNSIVYIGFIVKIHRFVLLREGAVPLLPLGGKPLARVFGVGLLITLALVVSALVLYAVLRPHYAGGVAFIGVVVGAVWIFVAVRLSLLFPAISTGSRIDLRGAWHDSSGHFWTLFGVPFVAVLPLVACAIVALIVLGVAGVTPAAIASPSWLLLLAAGQSVGNIVFALITSAALALLYRRYANRLPAPPDA
ncbi:hypothetical protein [Paraburkholderia dinghuensis]|uniref:Glycerophosphoryl diester phosphodiesterase membrane domain-containing protein n=1 Tax=Paraburkholderia dinghuensis TaxID=2305225 RepID=A0A3N6MYN6_9BURK|nr:hypothetical protein [Paraburkholderia dinghuensis]RQH08889.1 hypothetical protein D1Y85_03140 [Paraburkholderia dinghuensis]